MRERKVHLLDSFNLKTMCDLEPAKMKVTFNRGEVTCCRCKEALPRWLYEPNIQILNLGRTIAEFQ